MSFLFAILDIIVYLLMVILYIVAIIAVLLLAVLFIPIQYEIQSCYDSKLSTRADAAWFFGLIRLKVRQGTDRDTVQVSILWFTVLRKKKSEPRDTDEPAVKKDSAKRTGIVKRVANALSYPDKDEIIQLTLRLVKRLAKAVSPHKVTLRGEVGFDDPSSTGLLLGLLAIISEWLPSSCVISVAGNFEKKVLRLKTEIKGRMFIYAVLWPAAVYIFSKPIWALIMSKKNRKDE